jgi:hypothetical protein
MEQTAKTQVEILSLALLYLEAFFVKKIDFPHRFKNEALINFTNNSPSRGFLKTPSSQTH